MASINAPVAVRGWLPPVRVRIMALPVRLPAQPQRMSLSALPALSPPMTQFLDADLGRDFWTRPLKRSLTSVGASCRPQGLAKGKGGCLRLREGALSVEPGGKPAAAAAVMPDRLGQSAPEAGACPWAYPGSCPWAYLTAKFTAKRMLTTHMTGPTSRQRPVQSLRAA